VSLDNTFIFLYQFVGKIIDLAARPANKFAGYQSEASIFHTTSSSKKFGMNTEATIELAIKKDFHTSEGCYPERFFARIPAIPMVTSVLEVKY
jgi:hypothetical protein